MDTIDKIEQLEEDFTEGNGPFEDVEFPEARLLRELGEQIPEGNVSYSLTREERLKVLSAFCTFDYNRDANQLVDNLLELQERKPDYFDAYKLPASTETIEQEFKEIGFRYPSRDARGWFKNNEILRNKYNGEWTELLLATQLNAEQLVERLNDDGFLYLKGVKIAPMYARIINDEVAELRSLWALDIPVDTHIRRLSLDLADAQMGDDDIRAWWRNIGKNNDIDRHVVDGALWHIGNKWDEWGSSYWDDL